MTDAEQVLWKDLRRNTLRWRFRRQYPIPPFIVDFACIEARLIVEIDGGQHAIAVKDARRDAMLRRQGWRVLRFWNNEVFENRAGVLQTISDTLNIWPTVYPHPDPPPLAGEGVPAPDRTAAPIVAVKGADDIAAAQNPRPAKRGRVRVRA